MYLSTKLTSQVEKNYQTLIKFSKLCFSDKIDLKKKLKQACKEIKQSHATANNSSFSTSPLKD